jgi:hypothetical protein
MVRLLKTPTLVQEKACSKQGMVKAVKSVGNIEKELFAPYSAFCHPELLEQAKTVGCHLEESGEARTALRLVNQLRGMLVLAKATVTRQGRSKDDQQLFMEAVGSAVVPTVPGCHTFVRLTLEPLGG